MDTEEHIKQEELEDSSSDGDSELRLDISARDEELNFFGSDTPRKVESGNKSKSSYESDSNIYSLDSICDDDLCTANSWHKKLQAVSNQIEEAIRVSRQLAAAREAERSPVISAIEDFENWLQERKNNSGEKEVRDRISLSDNFDNNCYPLPGNSNLQTRKGSKPLRSRNQRRPEEKH